MVRWWWDIAPVAAAASVCLVTSTASAEELTAPPDVQPVIGGRLVDEGAFSQVVAIQGGPFLCSGTKVADDVVLTAAHCLAQLSVGTPLIVLDGPVSDDAEPNGVVDFGVHPDFVATPGAQDIYDIAFVRTERSLVGTATAPITNQAEWDETMQYDRDILVVGYGDAPDDMLGTGIKRQVAVSITRFSPEGLEFTAGGEGKDSCAGDSGGPAFVQLANGALRLAGITSRGSDPCGEGGIYAAPYPGLCWLRDESGLDLTNGCGDCNCLDTTPPPLDEPGCGCRSGGDGSGWLVLGLLVLVLGRRRRATS